MAEGWVSRVASEAGMAGGKKTITEQADEWCMKTESDGQNPSAFARLQRDKISKIGRSSLICAVARKGRSALRWCPTRTDRVRPCQAKSNRVAVVKSDRRSECKQVGVSRTIRMPGQGMRMDSTSAF